MATVTPTISTIGQQDGSLQKYEWTITATDDGAPMAAAEWADRSVQFAGNWAGGTVVFEGSNNGGITWETLNNPQGAAISQTANGLKGVVELAEMVRPRASVAVTSVKVSLVARRQPIPRN